MKRNMKRNMKCNQKRNMKRHKKHNMKRNQKHNMKRHKKPIMKRQPQRSLLTARIALPNPIIKKHPLLVLWSMISNVPMRLFTLPNDNNGGDYHEQEMEPAKTESYEDIQDNQEGQDLKLNISIRAKVHGNPLSKDFYGNGSIEMLPGFRGDDRLKRKCAEMPTVKPEFIEDSEGINSMASGKLSSEVVQAIFKSVKNEPSMQDLVPYLKEPPQVETTGEANLNAIKNQNNENEVKQAEKPKLQAMKAH
ncbi:hypothetical protein DOY81_011183 [Sarcophaga bullata]|nr:hypothetical protein DOY81_011183 [Sarcophaga bullata]